MNDTKEQILFVFYMKLLKILLQFYQYLDDEITLKIFVIENIYFVPAESVRTLSAGNFITTVISNSLHSGEQAFPRSFWLNRHSSDQILFVDDLLGSSKITINNKETSRILKLDKSIYFHRMGNCVKHLVANDYMEIADGK